MNPLIELLDIVISVIKLFIQISIGICKLTNVSIDFIELLGC